MTNQVRQEIRRLGREFYEQHRDLISQWGSAKYHVERGKYVNSQLRVIFPSEEIVASLR